MTVITSKTESTVCWPQQEHWTTTNTRKAENKALNCKYGQWQWSQIAHKAKGLQSLAFTLCAICEIKHFCATLNHILQSSLVIIKRLLAIVLNSFRWTLEIHHFARTERKLYSLEVTMERRRKTCFLFSARFGQLQKQNFSVFTIFVELIVRPTVEVEKNFNCVNFLANKTFAGNSSQYVVESKNCDHSTDSLFVFASCFGFVREMNH